VSTFYWRLIAFFLNACSQPVNLCSQRYSVAVYLVRVFTAADLFSQLKLCSVESAERCRERSKCFLCTLPTRMESYTSKGVCLKLFVGTVLVGLSNLTYDDMLSGKLLWHQPWCFVSHSSIVQDKLRFDPESEIATTGLRVSLICPVSIPSF